MIVFIFMVIGFCFNIKKNLPSTDPKAQIDAEFDAPETIVAIKAALESGGHRVYPIEADEKAYFKLSRLRKKLDIVFTIAEGMAGDAREALIPAMCDMLGIPYTHSSTLTTAIQLDKTITKKILIYHHIPTPKFQLFTDVTEPLDPTLTFPLILKPNAEGSSKGILNENLVHNQSQLRKRLAWEFSHFDHQVLVEEFLSGREFSVALLGNPPKVLPIIEQRLDRLPKDYAPFASYEVKWLWEDSLVDRTQAYDCPARLTTTLQQSIESVCQKTFAVLGCLDVARIDIRLDQKNQPHVLEINSLPGLMPDTMGISYFPIAARAAGYSYNETILAILNTAIKRLDLTPRRVSH